jgi:DNA-binding LacI/PurR family transcriptional regulator
MQALVQLQIDGILLQHRFTNPEYYQQLLQRQGIPAVGLVSPKPGFVSDLVRCDTTDASRQMVHHLVGLGHKRIAAIGPLMPSTLGGERHKGYVLGLNDAGIEVDEKLVMFEGWRTRDGYNMTHALLDREKPDAIFAFGPRLAAGAANALRERRLRVPHDIALVGVDDFGMGSELDPFMTVVRQPEREMGQRAANLLIERIQGKYSGEPREVVLPASVLVRRSCGATLAQDQLHAVVDGAGRLVHYWEDDSDVRNTTLR